MFETSAYATELMSALVHQGVIMHTKYTKSQETLNLTTFLSFFYEQYSTDFIQSL